VGVASHWAVWILMLPPLQIVIAIARLVDYSFFYFVSCLLAITVPAITMQWAFITMLVLLMSVVLNILYFAAAVTGAYSSAVDADIFSIFVPASITASHFIVLALMH